MGHYGVDFPMSNIAAEDAIRTMIEAIKLLEANPGLIDSFEEEIRFDPAKMEEGVFERSGYCFKVEVSFPDD